MQGTMYGYVQRFLLAAAFALVCVPLSAYAVAVGQQVPAVLVPQNVQFMYSNPNSFYACDYVVGQTTAMLQILGAKNVNVQCDGGIPYQSFNTVTATFSTARPTPTAEKSIFMATVANAVLEAHESCDLHLQIYQNVIKSFQVYAQQENDTCWDSQGDFQAKVTVLK